MQMRPPSLVSSRMPVQMGKDKPMQGGKWQIVEEFKGRSHKDGGIDIEVSGGYVRHIHAPNEKPDVIAKNGRFWKNLGSAAYGLGEGLLDTITFGATDQLTDMGYNALQKIGGSTEDEMREQNSIRGYGTAAGAIGGAVLTGGATTGSAIQQGAKGVGAGVSQGSPDSKLAQGIGTFLPLAGNIAGMVTGNAGYGAGIKAATEGAKTATAAGDIAKATQMANKAARLSKFSNIAETAGKMSKYNSLFQAGMSSMGSSQTQPIDLSPTQQFIRDITPFTSPSMMRSYKELGQELSGEASQKRGTGMSGMDGVSNYGGGIGGGPIQFQQQPFYSEGAQNYLAKYGINV